MTTLGACCGEVDSFLSALALSRHRTTGRHPRLFGRDPSKLQHQLGLRTAALASAAANRPAQTLRPRPPSTRAAAISFQAGSGSPRSHAEAPMPNTGTSSAIGVTLA